jgi:hypothetical protein
MKAPDIGQMHTRQFREFQIGFQGLNTENVMRIGEPDVS